MTLTFGDFKFLTRKIYVDDEVEFIDPPPEDEEKLSTPPSSVKQEIENSCCTQKIVLVKKVHGSLKASNPLFLTDIVQLRNPPLIQWMWIGTYVLKQLKHGLK
ncbi:hypothetical protein K435DRAFT_861801 [Dendrothele bispora CBS 962.96]|uniref:Uncharacterized protein n=1 Tax=Dendrothele bispora (strain CBS 962.96) TaxID=1314807 RepID=A0A4S8LUM7_DENBC|nr:hypothetical protein K435DRAFT_861801 [Dendrothele bispora CBS 962.96]